MIQGRSQIQQWVTKFKVQYGDNENSLKFVEAGGKPMVGYRTISSPKKKRSKTINWKWKVVQWFL